MKTDARVRYTKKVIQESFFELMKEKPVNKITVKSICELSEINRATFYKYYSDPFDLLKQIEDALIIKMRNLIEDADNKNITQTLMNILSAIKNNAEMYTLLISENGDPYFFNRVISDSFKIKSPIMTNLIPKTSQKEQEWLYCFMAQGFSSILISWVQNGMQEEAMEVASFINKLNNIVLKGLIE